MPRKTGKRLFDTGMQTKPEHSVFRTAVNRKQGVRGDAGTVMVTAGEHY